MRNTITHKVYYQRPHLFAYLIVWSLATIALAIAWYITFRIRTPILVMLCIGTLFFWSLLRAISAARHIRNAHMPAFTITTQGIFFCDGVHIAWRDVERAALDSHTNTLVLFLRPTHAYSMSDRLRLFMWGIISELNPDIHGHSIIKLKPLIDSGGDDLLSIINDMLG